MRDRKGVLSSLLAIFADTGANILTINQSIPTNGAALVTISATTENMPIGVDELIARVRASRTGDHPLRARWRRLETKAHHGGEKDMRVKSRISIGTVSGGTAEVLTKQELIAGRAGQEMRLKSILCTQGEAGPTAHLARSTTPNHDRERPGDRRRGRVHRRGDPRLRVRQALSRSGEKRRHVQ
ncbi:MAG: ACT domain-containing protein [Lachnospiraceae bacterium]